MKKQTKSDFVRANVGIPAKEVVARAAKKRMKLSERYVYVIRSADKAKKYGKRGRELGGAPAAERELRRAIANAGLARARRVIAELEQVVR
jgi:hypothetical protein